MMIRLSVVLTLMACGEKTIENNNEDGVDEVDTVADADGDGIEDSADCDDGDAELDAMLEDADCDGTVTADDCDDDDAEINPDAEDAWYDGVDSNCDGADDYDQDGDG